MKSYITGNPVQAAVVGLVAVLTSPVLLVAGWPLVSFLLVQLAPVLVPALLLAVVSASTDSRRSHHRFLDTDPGAPAQAEASHTKPLLLLLLPPPVFPSCRLGCSSCQSGPHRASAQLRTQAMLPPRPQQRRQQQQRPRQQRAGWRQRRTARAHQQLQLLAAWRRRALRQLLVLQQLPQPPAGRLLWRRPPATAQQPWQRQPSRPQPALSPSSQGVCWHVCWGREWQVAAAVSPAGHGCATQQPHAQGAGRLPASGGGRAGRVHAKLTDLCWDSGTCVLTWPSTEACCRGRTCSGAGRGAG